MHCFRFLIFKKWDFEFEFCVHNLFVVKLAAKFSFLFILFLQPWSSAELDTPKYWCPTIVISQTKQLSILGLQLLIGLRKTVSWALVIALVIKGLPVTFVQFFSKSKLKMKCIAAKTFDLVYDSIAWRKQFFSSKLEYVQKYNYLELVKSFYSQ